MKIRGGLTWSQSFANGLPLVPVIASILVSQSVSHLVTVSQSVSQSVRTDWRWLVGED